MSTITVTNLGKAYKQYPNRWARLAETLTTEFGRGFDERNLRYMHGFYQCFPRYLTSRRGYVESVARVGSADHLAVRQEFVPARLAQYRQATLEWPVLLYAD